MKTFADLENMVRSVANLLQQAQQARELPSTYAYQTKTYVNVYADSRSGARVEIAKEAATELQTRLVDEMRARGAQERDRILSEIALRIETFRGLLPGLAADACIDLGVQARALSEKAPA
jgi:hypothetical protein